MIPALPLFHGVDGRPVIVLGDGEAAKARKRLVERAGGIVAGEDDGAARLAFIAMAGPEAAAARLRARGVLVNVTDRPDLCDFTVPSVLDRAPLLIAVGTGGASAGLAKAVRLRLETVLPQGLGALARALGAARDRLRGRWPEAGERRRALDAALGEGGVLDPLDAGCAERIDGWLDGAQAPRSGGLVELRLASDDPDDLTLRQARLLGTADTIAHEGDVPEAILHRARADAVRIVLALGEAPTVADGLTIVLRR